MPVDTPRPPNRYGAILRRIFLDRHQAGVDEVAFARADLLVTAGVLGIELPKNLGDLVYSFRYRTALPEEITALAPPGRQWVIVGRGDGQYAFVLVGLHRVSPRTDLAPIKLPDATPAAIRLYALNDEQALLAIVRYNRLIDLFLGLTAYSLQNHLRTRVQGLGQIEIDELYLGIDGYGCHYVVPVQAKTGKDHLGVVQTTQDLAWCHERYPHLRCRAVSAQFMSDERIALFELAVTQQEIQVVAERHYLLVGHQQIEPSEVASYRR